MELPFHPPRPPGGSGSGPEQDGFALLVTLLVLVGLSALAAGGLALARTEASAARSHAAAVRAFLAAQAGTATFLARPRGPLAVSFETAYALSPRTAVTVRGERLLAPGPFVRLYRLTSVGTYAAGKDRASRTVSILAALDGAALGVPAALTTGGRIEVEGPDVRLDGHGLAPADTGCSGAGAPDVAGAAFPSGGYTQSEPDPLAASGMPDTLSLEPVGSPAAPLEAAWADLAAGRAAYDARLPADPWPAALGTADTLWRGILVEAPAFQVDAGRSGRGALVVTGDLVLGDGFRWEGLVLVGGRLRAEGTVAITGGVAAGLAGAAGLDSTAAHLGPGPVQILYDACSVARAGRFAAALEPVPGSWSEAFVPGG